MSRIDELIEELCPEGVPVFNLGDLIQENLGGGTPSRSDASLWNGSIPWASVGDLTASKLEIGYTRQSITEAGLASSSTNLIPEGWVVAAVKIAPGEMRVVRSPLAINQDLRGLRLSETVDPQFLVYLSKTISVKGNGTIVKGITNESLKKLQIPVPPLEVQREIVSTLDKFTQLEAELEAELEARRIQYEVTRDRLLDFSGDLDKHPMAGMIREYCPEGILNKELRSCGTFKKGGSFQKKDMIEIGQPAVHYGQIHTNPAVFLLQPPTRVSDAVFSSSPVADPGDLIIADTSEDLDGVATAVAWLGDSQIAVSGHVLIFSHDMEPKYVSYFFKTSEFKRQKNKKSKGVKVKDISSQRLGEVVIPVPPLKIQKEIVSILDRLDTLVNDITYGLPAEITARREQFEYYRNRLLTFKELEAA